MGTAVLVLPEWALNKPTPYQKNATNFTFPTQSDYLPWYTPKTKYVSSVNVSISGNVLIPKKNYKLVPINVNVTHMLLNTYSFLSIQFFYRKVSRSARGYTLVKNVKESSPTTN